MTPVRRTGQLSLSATDPTVPEHNTALIPPWHLSPRTLREYFQRPAVRRLSLEALFERQLMSRIAKGVFPDVAHELAFQFGKRARAKEQTAARASLDWLQEVFISSDARGKQAALGHLENAFHVGSSDGPAPRLSAHAQGAYTEPRARSKAISHTLRQFRLTGLTYLHEPIISDGLPAHARQVLKYDAALSSGGSQRSAYPLLTSHGGFLGVYPEAFAQSHLRKLYRLGNTPAMAIRRIKHHVRHGLFALEDVAAGRLMGCYAGVLVHEDIDTVPKTIRHAFALPNVPRPPELAFIAREMRIEAGHAGNETRFINHSDKKPNLDAAPIFHRGMWVWLFIANRNIRAEEQLFYDYGSEYWKSIGKKPLTLR